MSNQRRLTSGVTEAVLVDDPVDTRNLRVPGTLGVRPASEDLGAGFTFIGQVPTSPVKTLTIDRFDDASSGHADLLVAR